MNDAFPRLDGLKTRFVARIELLRAALRPRVAEWKTQLLSLREPAGRQEAWRAARPLPVYAVGFLLAESLTWLLAFALSPKVEGSSPLFIQGAVTVSALLLVSPKRWWIYLFVTLFLLPVNAWLFHAPPSWSVFWTLLLLYLAIVSLAVGTVVPLRRYVAAPMRFANARQVSRFVLCVCGGAILPACIVTVGRMVIFNWTFWFSWETAYFGYVLAILVFTPAIVLWATTDAHELHALVAHRWSREVVHLALGLLVVSVFVFGVRYQGSELSSARIYLTVPLLLWAAGRFGPRGIASALALTTLVAILCTTQGVGPYVGVGQSVFDNVFALQLFLIFVGVPLFFLAAATQERATAEVKRRASEVSYRAVVETQTEMITRYRPDTTLTFVNDATCRFDGKSREELLGTSILADMPEEAAARVRETIAVLLAEPDPGIMTIEHEARFHDGTLRWQQWVNRTILDADGQVIELQGIGRDITERKHAEEALRASEARYRAVVRNLPHTTVLLFDTELRHSFADGAGLALLGLTPGGVEGRTVWEAFPRELAAALAPAYAAAVSGQARELDVEQAPAIYRIQVVPMSDASPLIPATSAIGRNTSPVGMVVLRDITEQRLARDELVRERTLTAMLAARSQEFRTLAEHSPDVIARLDPGGRFVYVNQAGADMFGLAADHWVGKSLAELGAPQDISAHWAQALQDAVTTRAPATFDAEVQLPQGQDQSQGEVRSLHVRCIPEFADDGGQLVSVLGIATDVSALKQAEARLAEQASELEAIFEAQADPVVVYDQHRRLVRGNRAWEDYIRRHADIRGVSADPAFVALPLAGQVDWLNWQVLDERGHVIPIAELPTSRALSGELVTGEHAIDERVQGPDGRYLQLSVTAAPVRDREGHIVRAVVVSRDVTSRRQIERQVQEQASELVSIFDAMSDGVLVYDREGRMVRANRTWQDMFRHFSDGGLSADPTVAALPFAEQVEQWHRSVRLKQYPLHDAQGHEIPLEQTPTYRALRGEMVTGANAVDERIESADGRVFVVSVSAAPLRDVAGNVVGAVGVTREVTAQRQLERQVAEQARQLETIFEAQADGVAVFNLEGGFVRANSALRHLLGIAPDDDYLARPLLERAQRLTVLDDNGQPLTADRWPHWRALRGETFAGAGAVEVLIQTLDGREVRTTVSGAPMRAPDGQIVGAVLVYHDVTARRALERQVAEQAAQLAAIFEAMTDGVFVLDAQGHLTHVNPAAQALFTLATGEDRAPEEIHPTAAQRASALTVQDGTGQPLLPVELLPPTRLLRGEVLSGATALTLQMGTHPDRTRTISLTGGPLRDATGQIVGTVGVVRDVTELQRVQAALADQERLFRTLVEHSPDIIARFDSELRYLYVSPAIRQVSLLPETAHLGKTNAELGWPEAAYASAHRAIEQVFQTGQPQTLEEIDASSPDLAMPRYLRAHILPECAADGRVESVLTVTTDITALKRTEQALREANASLETARQAEERRKQVAESLRGVLAILNSTRSPHELLQYIVRQAEALLGSAAAVIYGPALLTDAITPHTQAEAPATTQSGDLVMTLRVQAAEGLRIAGRRPRSHQRLPFADTAVAQVLMSAQPVAVVDGRVGPVPGDYVASESETAAGNATAGDGHVPITCLNGELPAPYQTLLVVPIRVHAGPYGCLLLLYPQPRDFEAEEVALAQAYADQAAQAIINTRLQVHLEQEAAAAERNRLAQELHDTVKQELFSAGLVAQSLPAVWQTHRDEAEAALRQLHTMTQSAYAGLQALLLELRPAALERLPLAESLRQLGAAMSTRAGVPVVVDVEGSATPEPPLPTAVKIACYRVAQEALINSAKYAHAHAIHLRLRTKGANWLELELTDDGQGFDPQVTSAGHFGLAIMRERAHAVGASVQVQSHTGLGTAVVMRWQRTRKARAPQQSKRAEPDVLVRGGPA